MQGLALYVKLAHVCLGRYQLVAEKIHPPYACGGHVLPGVYMQRMLFHGLLEVCLMFHPFCRGLQPARFKNG